MRVFDYSFESPAENLALDEVLLEQAEAHDAGECLRFWESPVPFVVLGLTQPVADHVFVEACAADGVEVHRRCTAGGCVLQGPGCLNFSFVLRQDREGCGTIHGSYQAILGGIADSLKSEHRDIALTGVSDLAIGPHKISGNAQKRKRRYFLHHGTMLYAFDAAACGRYLREPRDRPDYRGERAHREFIRNLNSDRAGLIQRVSSVFQGVPRAPFHVDHVESARTLARTKYATRDWVNKR